MTATISSNGTWGPSANLNGGTFVYGDGDGNGTADITATYATGQVTLKGHISTYSGFGMWFGAISGQMYPCADASDYQGLSFEVVNNGTETPNINAQVQVHGDAPVDNKNKRGGCLWTDMNDMFKDCGYPNYSVTVPADGSAIQVPWSMFTGGKPIMDAQAGAQLDGVQWDFWTSTASPYDLDITIKNIKFY